MFKPIYLLGAVLGVMIYLSSPNENYRTKYAHILSKTEGFYPKQNSTTSAEMMMPMLVDCNTLPDTFYLDSLGILVLDSVNLNLSASGGVAPYTYEVLTIDTFDCSYADSVETIKIRVTDAIGDMDSCEHEITILDSLPPVFTCPADLTVDTHQDSCEVELTFMIAAPVDNCDSVTLDGSNGPDPSGFYPAGIEIVQFVYSDQYGNADSCSFTVTVHDFNPPQITCPQAATSIFTCSDSIPLPYSDIDAFAAAGGMIFEACALDSSSFTVNEIIDSSSCPLKIYRWYIISDTFMNTDSCLDSLFLEDEFKTLAFDQITMPNIILYTDPGVCSADSMLIQPQINKTCGVTISRIPSGNTFDIDTTVISWIAEDGCGDLDTISQNVIVIDDELPEVPCKKDTTAIGIWSDSIVELDIPFFFNGDKAEDNCNIDSVGMNRVNEICYSSDAIGASIFLCCSDVNQIVDIDITAFDVNGNSNTCRRTVSVHDAIAPQVFYNLPDITVSCDFYIDLKDLSPFGKVVFHEADRDTIKLDDPLYDNSKLDGLVTDNCTNLSIISDTNVDKRFNNAGDIERTIIVIDLNNDSMVMVKQTITIMDTDSLTIEDIQFPNDTTIVFNSCSDSIPAHMTGEPIIAPDDICTMVAAEYEDLVFDSPNSGCIFVKRTWTVIDMAKYQPNANPPTGIFTDVQYISVNNTEPPVIDSITTDLNYIGVQGACDVLVEMSITAMDSCTDQKDLYFQYFIDYNRDGTIEEHGENDSLSVIAEVGDHRVIWKVEDRCGNFSKYEVDFTAREGKAPVPVCYNGLSADLSDTGLVELWASEFNAGSYDNCTDPEDLVFSFTDTLNNGSITYTCADTGLNEVTVYVTDEEGNQSLCLTTILITDNLYPCPTSTKSTYRVGGIITTEDNISIPETKISISDLIETNRQMSNEKGKFMFDAMPADKDYYLEAEKNDQCLEGVSTLDLVLIQRHILNQEKLTSPYKLLAADINVSGHISASDLVDLRKLILGVNNSFENSDCWLFIDKNFVFDNPKSPWDYPKRQELNSLDIDILSSDFVAVKLGDVNNSVSNIYEVSTENRKVDVFNVSVPDFVFEEGEEIRVPVIIQNAADIIALQSNFSFANDALKLVEIENGQLNFSPDFYHETSENQLSHVTIAYSDYNHVELRDGEVLFTFVLETKSKGRLSNVFTENSTKLQSVAYDTNYEQHYLNFQFNEDNLAVMEVGVPSPNPFIGQTQINLGVATASFIELELYNQAGVKLYDNGAYFPIGRHQLEITDQMLKGGKGVFYLHISGPESHSVVKLIRIQ
jgi:hypothetical protein